MSNHYVLPEDTSSLALLNNNFNMKYVLNETELMSLYRFCTTDNKWSTTLSKFKPNPSDWLTSVRYYPINLEQFYQLDNNDRATMMIANKNVTYDVIESGETKTYVLEPHLLDDLIISEPSNVIKLLYQTQNFIRPFNSHLDYQCTYELYLPFFGFVDLQPEKVLGRGFAISLALDISSGAGTYILSTLDDNGDEYILNTYTTKIGIDIDFITDNTKEISDTIRRQWVNTVSTLMSSMAYKSVDKPAKDKAIGYAGARSFYQAARGISGIFGQYMQSQLKPDSISRMSDNITGLMQYQKIFMIIKKPRLKNITSYNSLYGRPLQITSRIGDLTGFTRIADVHLENFATATSTELEEIERILKSGFILPEP